MTKRWLVTWTMQNTCGYVFCEAFLSDYVLMHNIRTRYPVCSGIYQNGYVTTKLAFGGIMFWTILTIILLLCICLHHWYIVSVWIELIVMFSCFMFCFLFYFSLRVNSNLTWVHCAETKITIHALFITVHALKNIKNGSHNTIHTFKNYFATVLSVFNFQFQ